MIALKLPPMASSLEAPFTFVIARMSPFVWENVRGVLLINVVGLALPKFGLNASSCSPPATAGAATPQSAVAGRSFRSAGPLTAVQVLVLADAAVTAPAVVVSMAKTDKPMAADKPLCMAFPPGARSWV